MPADHYRRKKVFIMAGSAENIVTGTARSDTDEPAGLRTITY
jgi:hypothetical protein